MKNLFFFFVMVGFAITVSMTSCAKDDELAVSNFSSANGKVDLASAKEPVRRAYRDSFDTWYQIVPDLANGWMPEYGPFLTWVPGGGTGNATHMGNASTYFNQYIPFTPPVISSVPAPVTMFFGPALTAAGYPGIPSTVSYIVFDTKGNSIWFWQTSNSSTPTSPTRVDFSGTADIVGGTGKFSGATGEVVFNGYFNPQDPQDASVWDNGWIVY